MTSQTATFIHNHEYCSTFINLLWNYCVFQGCLAFQDQDTISLIPTYCSPKNSRVCSMIIIIHRPVKFRPWDLFLINALDLFGMRSPDITNQLQPLFGHWKQSPVSFNHCWLTTVVEATKNKWPQQFQQHFNPQVLSTEQVVPDLPNWLWARTLPKPSQQKGKRSALSGYHHLTGGERVVKGKLIFKSNWFWYMKYVGNTWETRYIYKHRHCHCHIST